MWNGTVCVAGQCGLRFCSQCLSDWHDVKSCDENMLAIHGKIDGCVLCSALYCLLFVCLTVYTCRALTV